MKIALIWILRLIPVGIMGQTLFFKFSGANESRELFATLTEKALGNGSLEAYARVGTGLFELAAIVLLLIPKWSLRGASLTIMVMLGALLSHIMFLGFQGIYGELSVLACIALMSSLIQIAMFIQWQEDVVRA